MNSEQSMDERDFWKVGRTYVVGHQRPDTDAIASALGYAWFLTNTDVPSVTAARAGQIPTQTSFALQRFGYSPPRLLNGVAPLFGHVSQPQKALMIDAPLSAAIQLIVDGQGIVPILDEERKPKGVVTPIALSRVYSAISQNPSQTPDILAQPCERVLESVPTFRARQRISDHRHLLLRLGADDFLVTDDSGHYIGIAARNELLSPPRAQLILVDHNELGQAVAGAEEAEIVAVLDHHRLGNSPTALPIPFMIEPVGSTSTLVAERCQAKDLTPPAGLAGVLLSGILSDTLVFNSPTSTARDRRMGEWLAELANVDLMGYGGELMQVTPGLMGRSLDDIIDSDRKNYEINNKQVSIGQVELTNLQELPHRRDELLSGLKERAEKESLEIIALMVTDIVTGTSHLLCEGESSLLAALPFARIGEREWNLGRIVSRKKQLVPALYDVLDGTS